MVNERPSWPVSRGAMRVLITRLIATRRALA